MASGRLVPDEITIGMVKERLAEADCRAGFLLDGFPRTVPQAVALNEVLKLEGEELDLVLNLQVPEELIFRRITNRLVCSACGKPYNKLDFPRQKMGSAIFAAVRSFNARMIQQRLYEPDWIHIMN